MKRKVATTLVVLLLLLGVNLTLLFWRVRARRPATTPKSTNSAKRTSTYPENESVLVKQELTRKAWMSAESPITLIGDLTTGGYDPEFLRLNREQIGLINELDKVVREGLKLSYLADANTTGKSSSVPWAELEATEKRRNAAIESAQRLVIHGILTDQQAAVLDQRLWDLQGVNALYRDDAARYLELTDRQKSELVPVRQNYADSLELLESAAGPIQLPAANAPNPDQMLRHNQHYETSRATLRDAHEQAVLDVLTPSQREKWTQATANTLDSPETPPESSGAKPAPKSRLTRSAQLPSAFFRSLRQRSGELQLSAEQKAPIDSFEDFTERGLDWVEFKLSRIDPPSGGDAKRHVYLPSDAPEVFLEHAKTAALNVILTERQAQQFNNKR